MSWLSQPVKPVMMWGMTTSVPPSNKPQQAPTQHGQPSLDPSGGHGSTQMAPPSRTHEKRQNVVGLIALITAIIGFIFACIPGALIVGWILLPIAFVLGLVSLFFKNKSKWMGITALTLSIVGTIVGVLVFMVVVSNAIDETLGGGDTSVSAPPENPTAEANQGPANRAERDTGSEESGTRGNPYPVGSIIENGDWRVVVNSVTPAATDSVLSENDFNEPPAEGSEYMLVNYSTTYIGNNEDGEMPAMVSVEYVTADGTTVNSYDSTVLAPDPIDTTSTLYKDGTITGNVVFEVPSDTATQGVLAITPGFLGDKVFVSTKE